MKKVKRTKRKNGWEDYKTTLILLSIVLAVMSLVLFMPLKHNKQNDNGIMAIFSK